MIFGNRTAGAGALAACIAALAVAPISQASAQGSLGGSIGKQDKVISGGETAAPSRPAARQSSRPAPSSRQRAEPRERAAPRGRSLTGVWSWTGHCAKYDSPYVGLLTINQSGNTFTATHGNTNTWDNGTVSGASISGSRVSFTRTFGGYSDYVALTLNGSGTRMSGVIPNTAHSGRCVMNFTRN